MGSGTSSIPEFWSLLSPPRRRFIGILVPLNIYILPSGWQAAEGVFMRLFALRAEERLYFLRIFDIKY